MAQAQKKTDDTDLSFPDMKNVVALCKRRGFIFQASDLYGGLNGFWDFGPLGTQLKNNLRDLWWQSMVITPPVGPDGDPLEIVGLDSAIIQNPKVWEASGHVGGFSDPMVDCRDTKLRYRADHLFVVTPMEGEDEIHIAFEEGATEDDISKKLNKLRLSTNINDYTIHPLTAIDEDQYEYVVAPDTKKKGTLTAPREFNLMFETYVGATANDENKAYLRPETAQGIFLNYKNLLDSTRVKVPFGIAQIGKAFRNEVTPRNFIYRSREFEQMELEWFCPPDEAEKWFEFWIETRKDWWASVGLTDRNIKIREHGKDELSHYAQEGLGTVDVEYRFPFTAPDFGELEGVAHRCDYDLRQHQEHSNTKLRYIDPYDTSIRYIPHVIEPAAGLTRGALALICEAYTEDPERPSGVYLNFHPSVAPKKAAILPLTAKDDHVPLARKLYMELREHYNVDLDIKQNIGKRYARQDEIGTPFCFTIDNQSNDDHTVTVRHRNTMKQDRIHMDKVLDYMESEMDTFSD